MTIPITLLRVIFSLSKTLASIAEQIRFAPWSTGYICAADKKTAATVLEKEFRYKNMDMKPQIITYFLLI